MSMIMDEQQMLDAGVIESGYLWDKPFQTPMMAQAYQWSAGLISGGHTGGVLYASTRMGKTKTVELLTVALKRFQGPRGIVESTTFSMVAHDRKVRSEGGFWDWFLGELGHFQSGRRASPIEKRHCVCEAVKGLAAQMPSGRILVFVDEAQFLDQAELGWFADLFNDLAKHKFKMVLFLVGSFLLNKWLKELKGKPQEHVMARFFANQHRLRGLSSVTDFQSCLRHFDTTRMTDTCSITATQAYLPMWYSTGGRLEGLADNMREAFRDVGGWTKREDVNVPMLYFILIVRRIFDYREQSVDLDELKQLVLSTGFAQWARGFRETQLIE